MTLPICIRQIGSRDFNYLCTEGAGTHHRADCPNLVSYPGYISSLPRILGLIMAYPYTLFGDRDHNSQVLLDQP